VIEAGRGWAFHTLTLLRFVGEWKRPREVNAILRLLHEYLFAEQLTASTKEYGLSIIRAPRPVTLPRSATMRIRAATACGPVASRLRRLLRRARRFITRLPIYKVTELSPDHSATVLAEVLRGAARRKWIC